MGKSRRNRAKSARHDPLSSGKPKAPKPPTDPELAALREAKILPVLRDLQSSDPKRRTAAAGAVANIVNDARCRKLLLREQVVRIVLDGTITDAAIESRAAGWEILRVLADREEADFCVHLFRLDIVTALSYAAMMIIETLEAESPEFDKLPRAHQDVTWAISTSLVSLINDVALATPDALAAISADDYITNLVFFLIDKPIVPPAVHDAALACVWALSEGNKPLAELIVSSDDEHNLKVLKRITTIWCSSAGPACGVLHNVAAALGWYGDNLGPDGLSDATLVAPLSEIIRSFGPGGRVDEGYRVMEPEEVQVALEVLASIGTELQASFSAGQASGQQHQNGIGGGGGMEEDDSDDDEEEEEEHAVPMDDSDDDGEDGDEEEVDHDELPNGKGEGDDHEMAIDDILADIDMVTGDGPDGSDNTTESDIPVLGELCRRAIPQLIRLATATTTTPNSSPDASPVLDIAGHALAALNNIAWSVSCLDFSDTSNARVAKTWEPSARAIWDSVIAPVLASDTADLELAARVTGLAWAVSRTMHGRLAGDGAHRKFIALYNATKGMPPAALQQQQQQQSQQSQQPQQQRQQNPIDEQPDPFQALGVKCIGVLGQLAMHPAPAAVNREIGVFLLTVLRGLPEHTPVADAVEALDQLMDVYGDESFPYDAEVFWADGFLGHFEEARHGIKAAAKTVDKRAMEELRTRADEAVLNLARFVQYKKKHKLV